MKAFFAVRALVEKKGKILVLRESGSYVEGTKVGQWDVPGGRLEAGEGVWDGLVREVREECGLEIEVNQQPVALKEWWPKPHGEEWHVVANFFHCPWKGGDVKLSQDHDAFEWIAKDDISTLQVLPEVRDVLNLFWERQAPATTNA